MIDKIRYASIVVRARVIWCRKVFGITVRKSGNTIVRDSIPKECLTCRRIDDRSSDGRKVSCEERGVRNSPKRCSSLCFPQTFKCSKEEGLVPFQRSSTGSAVLVATELGLSRVEELTRVEVVVSQEFINASVEVVRSGSRNCSHHRLSLSKLRGKGVAIDFELLNGINVEIQGEIVET